MDDTFKSRVMLGLSILTLIFLISTIASCNKAAQQYKNRQKEIEAKLDAEEKLEKLIRAQNGADERLAKQEQELEAVNSTLEATKKALLQEQLVNQSLKDELLKVNKLKETLEENLKEALANNNIPSVPKPAKK